MKEKGWRGFIGTLKCLVGLHQWGKFIYIYPWAYCQRCGKPYGANRRGNIQRNNVVMGDMAGGDIVKTNQPNMVLTNKAR